MTQHADVFDASYETIYTNCGYFLGIIHPYENSLKPPPPHINEKNASHCVHKYRSIHVIWRNINIFAVIEKCRGWKLKQK